jgi:hypothetical protein
MKPGKRFGLSAIEKRDIWSRWKAGQSLHEIGVLSARNIPPFAVCCCLAEGFLPSPVAARG